MEYSTGYYIVESLKDGEKDVDEICSVLVEKYDFFANVNKDRLLGRIRITLNSENYRKYFHWEAGNQKWSIKDADNLPSFKKKFKFTCNEMISIILEDHPMSSSDVITDLRTYFPYCTQKDSSILHALYKGVPERFEKIPDNNGKFLFKAVVAKDK